MASDFGDELSNKLQNSTESFLSRNSKDIIKAIRSDNGFWSELFGIKNKEGISNALKNSEHAEEVNEYVEKAKNMRRSFRSRDDATQFCEEMQAKGVFCELWEQNISLDGNSEPLKQIIVEFDGNACARALGYEDIRDYLSQCILDNLEKGDLESSYINVERDIDDLEKNGFNEEDFKNRRLYQGFNKEALDKLARDDIDTYRCIAAESGIDEYLDMLVTDPSSKVRCAVAAQKRDKDLDILRNDSDEDVRVAVAKIGRPQDLEILAQDEDFRVACEVAKYGRPQDLEIIYNSVGAQFARARIEGQVKHTPEEQYKFLKEKEKNFELSDVEKEFVRDFEKSPEIIQENWDSRYKELRMDYLQNYDIDYAEFEITYDYYTQNHAENIQSHDGMDINNRTRVVEPEWYEQTQVKVQEALDCAVNNASFETMLSEVGIIPMYSKNDELLYCDSENPNKFISGPELGEKYSAKEIANRFNKIEKHNPIGGDVERQGIEMGKASAQKVEEYGVETISRVPITR